MATTEALAALAPYEERILRLRYGLGCAVHTVDETARQIAAPPALVARIEATALRKLKHPGRRA